MVDQGRKFYNKLMQKWFDNNDILMSLTQKSITAEKFIRKLKAKIYFKKWQLIKLNLILLIWIN